MSKKYIEEINRLRESIKWERMRRLELEAEIGQIRSILNYDGNHLPDYIRSLLRKNPPKNKNADNNQSS